MRYINLHLTFATRVMKLVLVGAFGTPRFGPRGSAMVPIERAVVVCNRLSIVTIDVSLHLASWYAFYRSRLMFFFTSCHSVRMSC